MMSLVACAIGPAFGGMLVHEFGIAGAMTFLFLVTSALPLLAVIAPAPTGSWSRARDWPNVVVPDAPVPVGQS